MNYRNDKEIIKKVEKRIKIAHIFIIVLFIFTLGYLFLLQVFDIRHYKQKAINQRLSKNFIMRGQILDRNGLRLAVDKTSYNLYLHKEYFDHEPEELAKEIAPILNMEKSAIIKAINKPDKQIF